MSRQLSPYLLSYPINFKKYGRFNGRKVENGVSEDASLLGASTSE